MGAAVVRSDSGGMDTTLDTGSTSWHVALRPLTTARGWTTLTHNLLGLPLGIVYFTWLVTGLATGLGLAVTIIGIPILTLVLATVRPLLEGERAMANALLGTDIPAAGLAPQGEGLWGRFKAYWTDSRTWRGVGYLLARFPVGTFTFSVAVAAYSTALWLIAAPLLAPLNTMDFGFWEPDTVLDGLALFPAGVLLLVAAGWISEGLGEMSRALARWGAR
jgi:hypothetical protein